MIDGLSKKVAKVSTHLLYLLIVLLPWQARYIILEAELNGAFWEYATISMYVVDLLILIVLLTALYSKDKKGITGFSKIVVSLLAFVVYLFIQQAVTPFQQTSATGALYIGTALFLIMSLLLISWERKKILVGIVIAGLWSGALGTVQFFNGEVIANTLLGISAQNPLELGVSIIDSSGTRFLRSYGSLSHPNMLGGLLAISILSAVAVLGKCATIVKRLLVLASLVFLTSFLFITFSRSAILALLIGLSITGFIIFYKNIAFEKNSFLKGLLVILSTLLIATMIFSDEVGSRFSQNRLEQLSISQRVDSIRTAKELFFESPFFGTGFNTYTEALAVHNSFAQPAWVYQPVHNVALLSLIQLGSVGMLIVLLLLFYYIKDFFSYTLTSERIYLIGMISTFVVISLFDHYLLSSHFGLLFLIIIFSLTLEKSIIKET